MIRSAPKGIDAVNIIWDRDWPTSGDVRLLATMKAEGLSAKKQESTTTQSCYKSDILPLCHVHGRKTEGTTLQNIDEIMDIYD